MEHLERLKQRLGIRHRPPGTEYAGHTEPGDLLPQPDEVIEVPGVFRPTCGSDHSLHVRDDQFEQRQLPLGHTRAHRGQMSGSVPRPMRWLLPVARSTRMRSSSAVDMTANCSVSLTAMPWEPSSARIFSCSNVSKSKR